MSSIEYLTGYTFENPYMEITHDFHGFALETWA